MGVNARGYPYMILTIHIVVDNACDDQHLVYHTERPLLSTARNIGDTVTTAASHVHSLAMRLNN